MKNTADNIYETNKITACGQIKSPLQFSHKTYGEAFYTFELGIERRSGYVDEINVMISERLIYETPLQVGDFVEITGQIRTYNETVEGRNKLNVVVFAREIIINEDMVYYENYVYLEGFLCKPPIKRTSPLGRDICDLMIAVNRMYNKSDYIPCIAWGRNANYAETLGVGTKIFIEGRIQSREYKKKFEDGTSEVRKAFEVSILKLEEDADGQWDEEEPFE
jgi:primosomal replication protein N